MKKTERIYSQELKKEVCLSIGEYVKSEDEERAFYIVINDEDELYSQFAELPYEQVLKLFNEIKSLIGEDDFFSRILQDIRVKYGFFVECNEYDMP